MSRHSIPEIELDIDSLAAGGDGVGRHDGRVVFVPLSAPGDRVRVELVEMRRRFARGRILELVRAGKRREPPCPYFASCGGCSWQHLPEDVQSEARERIVRDALQRIARIGDLPDFEHIASPLAFAYRARARVAYASGWLGFRERASHRVVPIDTCAVLDVETRQAMERLRARLPRGRGECEIRGFEQYVEGLRVSPGSFFQANRALWKTWRECVVGCCGEGEFLLELYAGVGFYTALLEARFSRIVAVEQAASAADLAVNTDVHVIQRSAEAFLEGGGTDALGLTTAPDVVLLNPPRTGCKPGVLRAVGELRPSRIVYVSCEPSTLARDLVEVQSSHALRRVIVLDALPQTHHVEVICVLERLECSECD